MNAALEEGVFLKMCGTCQQTSPWGSVGSAKAQEEESKQHQIVWAGMGLRVL